MREHDFIQSISKREFEEHILVWRWRKLPFCSHQVSGCPVSIGLFGTVPSLMTLFESRLVWCSGLKQVHVLGLSMPIHIPGVLLVSWAGGARPISLLQTPCPWTALSKEDELSSTGWFLGSIYLPPGDVVWWKKYTPGFWRGQICSHYLLIAWYWGNYYHYFNAYFESIIISFNLHNNHRTQLLLISPFLYHRWGNWGTDKYMCVFYGPGVGHTEAFCPRNLWGPPATEQGDLPGKRVEVQGQMRRPWGGC